MSLQVWLPLNGDLHNQGLSTTTFSGTATYKSYGKLGGQSLNLQNRIICSTPALNGVQFFSIAFWGRIEANPDSTANWMDVIGFTDQKNDNSATGQFRFETGYGHNSTGGIHWHDNTTNAIIEGSNTYNTATQQNEWHHIVVTVADDSIKSYYDGALQSTYTINLNKGHLTGSWWLGESTTRGCIQDVRIYDHALSPKEVEEIAKGLVLHYPLNNNSMGGDNFLGNSNASSSTISPWGNWGTVTSRSIELIDGKQWFHLVADGTHYGGYYQNSYSRTGYSDVIFKPNTDYTISALWFASANASCRYWFHMRSSDGGNNISQPSKNLTVTTTPTRFSFTFNSGSNSTYTINRFCIMMGTLAGTPSGTDVYFTDVKMEEGTTATVWSPAKSELGDMATTVYDCSGYSNNGTIVGNLTAAAGSPRYDVATVFNGTNSTIKVIDNNWCSQGMEAMTINVWVKSSSWPTNTRIFSCTESGGFNTESGSSGYYRFPINVYTNAEKTSHAYKYDSKELQISSLSTTDWMMLTFVYDLTGTKTYINGELHHTYTNVSYGIYFNLNARLFLGCEANTANPSTPYFNGQQSDFRIYTTALTAEQIKELYNTSMSIDSNGNIYARELVEL